MDEGTATKLMGVLLCADFTETMKAFAQAVKDVSGGWDLDNDKKTIKRRERLFTKLDSCVKMAVKMTSAVSSES
jgi:hypothetical protein